MVLLLVLHFYVTELHPLAFIIPPLLYFALLSWGSAYIQSNYHLKVISRASHHHTKAIALSFDDGPDPHITPQVLAILKKNQITAAFFCIGKKIAGNESLIQSMHQQGHLLANHSYSHAPFIDFHSAAQWEQELIQTNQLIKNALTLEPLWFRPPYGVTTPNLAAALERLQLKTIGWDVRSLDTLNQSPEKIAKRVAENIKPGSLVLFHDTNQRVIEALELTIDSCKKNGYKIVSPQALLNIQPYA